MASLIPWLLLSYLNFIFVYDIEYWCIIYQFTFKLRFSDYYINNFTSLLMLIWGSKVQCILYVVYLNIGLFAVILYVVYSNSQIFGPILYVVPQFWFLD